MMNDRSLGWCAVILLIVAGHPGFAIFLAILLL